MSEPTSLPDPKQSEDRSRIYDIGISQVEAIAADSQRVLNRLRLSSFTPNKRKELSLRFTLTDAASMVGRSVSAIRKAEAEGRLPTPELSETNRRLGYTLEQLNMMREHFGTRPWRAEEEEPIILSIQNFKGGVGKSTVSCHLAQHLALKGYRVLLIDADPQASTTSLFGLNPDDDIDAEEETLLPFLAGEAETLGDVVCGTYWPQLDLIPSNLGLFNAEYLMSMMAGKNPITLDRLRRGLDEIKWAYDAIIIDPPPALGMIPLSVLRGANAIVVPVRPAVLDFSSTSHFFKMLTSSLETLQNRNLGASYKFMKLLINDMDDGKSMHVQLANMMQAVYGHALLRTTMKDSAEIDNAGARLMTVYELTKPITTKRVHDRCVVYLDQMNTEIETAIRLTWPSHRESLRQEGLL